MARSSLVPALLFLAACTEVGDTPPTTGIARPEYVSTAAAATEGAWSPPIPWPVTPVHASLLPDGRVLAWGSENPWDSTYQKAATWDPATDQFIIASNTSVNIFCGGHSILPDGRLLVTGGHLPGQLGKRDVEIFDPATNTWSPAGLMYEGRWYPTNVTLASGEVLILAGLMKNGKNNPIPEVWNPSGTIRKLTGASRTVFFYPWLFLYGNGKVFHAGPNQQAMFLATTGTGKWSTAPRSSIVLRDYGTAVMYEKGKILIAGGGNASITNTAETINLNTPATKWIATSPMHFARRHVTGTALPTGEVLVVGGTSAAGFNNVAGAVLTPEIWDPNTGTWRLMAAHQHNRLYHSVSVLLPDGRVLVGGGTDGPSGEATSNYQDVEIFSPPYLFQADGSPAVRPAITAAPRTAAAGQTISIDTPDAARITRVTLTRTAAVTHAFNQDNRTLKLNYTVTPTGLAVTIPPNRNDAPPGYYLLFLVNDLGVPSVGVILQVT